ncbi:Low affinity K(+) transporter 1 [Psilocybe cubensis]|uniref:Vacuole protein n=2 Tax=Psilocybe cubensis TaxID=181762 RepID=A0A8H7Y198_PSICU|nr:Low affinity K(+) transporter 1 [Psilocybe cubensis]KAH9482811.1 Low affinity K(+) transporter 1 [Psilocybe cubensis]
MCNCGGPKWKREVVPDHKFDFINTAEFTDNGFMMRVKYLWLYIIVLKSFLVYISDIFSAITMLTTKNWSNEIFLKCPDVEGCFFIPFNTGKWLFVGCIIVSFLLLAYESRKAKKIIASRDISYAFTNIMANNYYSLRSYDHFCFFDHISNSTKTSDDFAFFVFFTFKSWKRLILADTPRQTINALTLYAVYLVRRDPKKNWWDVSQYFVNSTSTSALTVTSFFTVVVCIGSLLLLVVAGICYIPLLLHIRGNLKEYCCHKVDKRIGVIIKRKQKERRLEADKLAQKEALGDYSHLRNKKGELIAQPLPQPTLPNLSVDDDDDSSSINTRVAPSTHTKDYYPYQSDKDYPPMPAYNPHSPQAPGNYYNPSSATLGYDEPTYPHYGYEDDNESTVNLAASAAPFAQDPITRQGSPYGPSYPGSYDPHDVYQGRAGSVPPHQQQRPPPIGQVPNGQGYDNPYGGYANSTSSMGPVAPGSRGRNYDEEVAHGRIQPR